MVGRVVSWGRFRVQAKSDLRLFRFEVRRGDSNFGFRKEPFFVVFTQKIMHVEGRI